MKFKMSKGASYYHTASGNCGTTEKDHYTTIVIKDNDTPLSVWKKVKKNLKQQIAIDEMHNVKQWVNIEISYSDIELLEEK